MLAQRGRGAASTQTERPAKSRTPSPRTRRDVQKRRMNFSDRHALEQLPHRLSELDKMIARLHQELSVRALFTDDPKKFAALSQALADAQHEHAKSEERWLELALLHEQLERG
jgi:ATP-binding cassette subfamily F protein uup